MDGVTRGSVLAISGEALRDLLGLPRWARIMKIVASEQADYVFHVVYFDRESYEIAEAQAWPVIKKVTSVELCGEREIKH